MGGQQDPAQTYDHVQQQRHVIHQQLQKVLVITEANAVAEPGTVVVHAENAPVAALAVVRPWRLHLLAFLAVGEVVDPRLELEGLADENLGALVAVTGTLLGVKTEVEVGGLGGPDPTKFAAAAIAIGPLHVGI